MPISGPPFNRVGVNQFIALVLFLLVILLYATYDVNQDFAGTVPQVPEETIPKTIEIPTHPVKHKLGYQDPNNLEWADPTDLQAEEEGLVEDSLINR